MRSSITPNETTEIKRGSVRRAHTPHKQRGKKALHTGRGKAERVKSRGKGALGGMLENGSTTGRSQEKK